MTTHTTTHQGNETLVQTARRAMKNADANGKPVRMSYQDIRCIVYPNDNPSKILRWYTVELIKAKIAELQGRLQPATA